MAPCKVAVVPAPDETSIELLVPSSNDLTVASLVEIALKRASKRTSTPLTTNEQTELRLNTPVGYHVDAEDKVEEVLSSDDVLVILLTKPHIRKDLPLQPKLPQKLISSGAGHTQFQIRVITPSAAVQHVDVRPIPLLKGGQVFSDESTLQEIKIAVCEHFGLHETTLAYPAQHCNCKLAEQLLERGNWQKFACGGHQDTVQCNFSTSESVLCARCSLPLTGHETVTDDDGNCTAYVLTRQDLGCGHTIHRSCIEGYQGHQGHWYCPISCQSLQPISLNGKPTKCFVISGAHLVETIDIETPSILGIVSSLKRRFGDNFQESLSVHTKGGLEGYGGEYSVLPIVSVCSNSKHNPIPGSSNDVSALASPVSVTLDLHTAESPITTQDLEQTIGQVGLSDLVINGVLSLYALSRRDVATKAVKKGGKNETYTFAPHWEASVSQSDRATAAFLSSLRMFSHTIGSKDFEDFQQNEILGLIHQLTRFPPTVRAIHIVMSGQSLRSNESAAVVQSFDALLQTVIPLPLIDNDCGRVLEGSRLLFGLILARMRKEKSKTGEDAINQAPSFPYIKSYHTVDLRDVKLNDPVVMPVQTGFGLVDENVFHAHQNGGVFGFTPADSVGSLATKPNIQVLRVARLFGGQAADVTYYNSDVLSATLQSSVLDLSLKELKRFSTDLKYLASLCETTSMAVVRPRSLPNASVPCLTLDRDGHLAVNLGHAPCSHDMLIFKPILGVEEQLDAAVVEQLLEPIVQARERDGTAVFDIFSTSFSKKFSVPSELLMFVVDASNSMDRSSDFAELNDLQHEPVLAASGGGDLVLDDHDSSAVGYPEIMEWLIAHESFADMIAVVHNASSTRSMPTIGREVIHFLRKLTSRELSYQTKAQNRLQSWATSRYVRGHSTGNRVDKLRRLVSGLELFEKPLIDFLVFRARAPAYSPSTYVWHYGDPVPVDDETSIVTAATIDLTTEFVVPENFICPISQAIFEDPVKTSDTLGPFDRRAIERWFRVRKSSPLTGLPLNDTTLRHDQTLYDEIKRWTSGDDITAAAPPASKRSRRNPSDSFLTINFVTPTGSFTRNLPGSLTTAALHRLVFRGMRGVHSTFSVSHRGNIIPPSTDTIASRGLGHNSELVVHSVVLSSDRNVEDMCLVKIYSKSRNSENCAYWVSRRTPATVASILFRHWLVNQHNYMEKNPDRQVWSGLYNGGDGLYFGSREDTWAKLTTLFEDIQPKQLIRREPLVLGRNDDEDDDDKEDGFSDDEDEDDPEADQSPSYDSYRVLKVELGEYVSPDEIEENERRKLRMFTRMAVSKQVFNTFINRLVAYSFPSTVGLVTFGSQAKIAQPMTDVIENFRTAVDKITTNGDTALWDAIHLAADQLKHHRRRDPTLKCRIICLSDGCDTNSIRNVAEVCKDLIRDDIVLDSVSIGIENNLDLRTVSYLTGGYAFVPQKLEDAVGICELEPVLSQHERPPIVRPIVPALLSVQAFRMASAQAEPTKFTRDIFPARKAHPMLDDSFVKISALQSRTQHGADESQGIQSGIRTRRLLTEIREISMNTHPFYDVYVSESNMGFWKVVVAGPAGSAYENAVFVLYLDMPEDYPRNAPKGRFVTPIFHPNISRHGLICHSILDRDWTADTTLRQVLDAVFGLLLQPEFTEPINTTVILSYYWDEIAFREEAKKHIEKFAKKGREELGREILGE